MGYIPTLQRKTRLTSSSAYCFLYEKTVLVLEMNTKKHEHTCVDYDSKRIKSL